MRAFWNDCGRGPDADSAEEGDLKEALRSWLDEVRGVKGNFFGLIDDQANTIQFYFDAGIPDHVDDAGHLRIVSMDFPQPDRGGSFARDVTIGEVYGLIEKAFKVGADHSKFDDLSFTPW